MTKKTLGVIATLAASLMWAVEPIFAKLSYQTTDFLNTFATRTIFCLVTISIFMFVKKENFKVRKEYIPKLIYLSLAATLFADLMYIYALTRVPVINAVLIGHMQPIFVILIGAFVLTQDRITKYDYCGILFMIIAGIFVTTKTAANLKLLRFGTVGDLYVLFATIAWATTAIVARKYLKSLPAGVVSFYRFLFAGIVFLLYMLVTKGIEVTSIYQILIGFVIGIGTILYYTGIRLIKAAQVSALELSTPFFAVLLGFLVLREYITMMQFIGILLLFGGIYFLSKKETSKSDIS
jgi:drug/metabolite transporter (DMT)-like permease